jgi:hypothetical protein
MPISQLRTAAPPATSLADNSTPDALAGKSGEAIIAELHGKYYTQTYRGNVFVGSTAIGGVALTTSVTTAQVFMVWNPLGSGKNIVPINTTIGYVSGTGVAANLGYSYLTGMGSNYSVAGGCSAATLVAPVNMNLGSGVVSVAKFAPATATVIAPTYLRSMGVSQLALTAATTTAAQWVSRDDFDGHVIIGQGAAIFVIGVASITSLFDISMVWAEVPA